MTTTDYTNPDQAISDEAIKAITDRYKAAMNGWEGHTTAELDGLEEDIRTMLAAAVDVGWVLVPIETLTAQTGTKGDPA